MNAFRKTSLFVLVAFVAVLALSVFPSSAEAGGCHSSGYGGGIYSSYSNYGNYGNYSSCYGGNCYWPTTYQYVKPVSYPVTFYDCYGRPYVVWQTSYSYQP
jgi:hypothetical protein